MVVIVANSIENCACTVPLRYAVSVLMHTQLIGFVAVLQC